MCACISWQFGKIPVADQAVRHSILYFDDVDDVQVGAVDDRRAPTSYNNNKQTATTSAQLVNQFGLFILLLG